jgi:putative membrane protein
MLREYFCINRRSLISAATTAMSLAVLVGGTSIAHSASASSPSATQPASKMSSGTMKPSGKMSSSTMNASKMAGTKRVASADRAFANKAAQGGAMEVMLGKLAQQNGSSVAVKSFGQRMVTDHTKANKDLDQTAKSLGLTLNWRPTGADRATVARLAKLHGAAFDKAYTADMVRDHTKDVADFQKEATRGKTPEIKAFAQRTLPTLKSHLQMAQSMKSSKPYAHRKSMKKAGAMSGTNMKKKPASTMKPGGTMNKSTTTPSNKM